MLVIINSSSGDTPASIKEVVTLQEAIEEVVEIGPGVVVSKETYWTIEIYDAYRE